MSLQNNGGVKMERNWTMWWIPTLAMGVIGLGLYGFNEHQNRMAAVQLAENQYQGSYHRMTSQVDQLQDSLAKVMVTRSPQMIERELSAAVRETSSAIANLESLPANLTRKGELMGYFTHTSAYLEQLHLSHLYGNTFSATERQQIGQIYKQMTALEKDTVNTQKNLLSKMNSYKMTAAVVAQASDVTLQKQFDSMDGDAKQMLAENQHMHMDPLQVADAKEASLLNRGPVINSTAAVLIAKRFMGYNGVMPSRVQNLGSGFAYQGYLVTLLNGSKETDRLAVSLHQGHVIFASRVLLNQNTAKQLTKGNLLTAQQNATTFLHQHGFSAVALLRSYESQNGFSFAFSPVRHGVAIEPQVILLKVHPLNGEVTDYDASAYFENKLPAMSLQPKLTSQQALQQLSRSFKVESEHLAVVFDAAKIPRLVYSILGRTSDNTFQVIVDAKSGAQLQIEKLTKNEMI